MDEDDKIPIHPIDQSWQSNSDSDSDGNRNSRTVKKGLICFNYVLYRLNFEDSESKTDKVTTAKLCRLSLLRVYIFWKFQIQIGHVLLLLLTRIGHAASRYATVIKLFGDKSGFVSIYFMYFHLLVEELVCYKVRKSNPDNFGWRNLLSSNRLLSLDSWHPL